MTYQILLKVQSYCLLMILRILEVHIKDHEDYTQLPLDLNCLSEWSSKWNLKFNVNVLSCSYRTTYLFSLWYCFITCTIHQRPQGCG